MNDETKAGCDFCGKIAHFSKIHAFCEKCLKGYDKQTASQFATKKCCGTSRAPSSAGLDAARASEREKSLATCSKWNTATIAEVAKIKQEAYAKGKVDGRLDGMAPSLLEEAYLKGQRSKTAYELGKADGKEEVYEKYPTTNKEKNVQIMSYDVGYSEGFDAGEKSGLSDGYKKGQESMMKTCSECQKVQYKKGQAELIEKLKVEMTLAGWHQGMSIHQEQEMGDYRRGQIDVMRWLERKASESLGATAQPKGNEISPKTKPENACGCGDDNHATHRIPNKPENACKHEWGDGHTPDGRTHWESCIKCGAAKPEKPKTKRRNGYAKRL